MRVSVCEVQSWLPLEQWNWLIYLQNLRPPRHMDLAKEIFGESCTAHLKGLSQPARLHTQCTITAAHMQPHLDPNVITLCTTGGDLQHEFRCMLATSSYTGSREGRELTVRPGGLHIREQGISAHPIDSHPFVGVALSSPLTAAWKDRHPDLGLPLSC